MSQNSYLSDVTIQNLLDDHAKSLLSGTLNRHALLTKYGVNTDSPVIKLLDIAERIHANYTERQPNPEFVNHLYKELLGEANRPFWSRIGRTSMRMEQRLPNLPNLPTLNHVDLPRWKDMSPAMQFAAGIGGLTLMWIAARAVRDTMGAMDSEDGTFAELSAS